MTGTFCFLHFSRPPYPQPNLRGELSKCDGTHEKNFSPTLGRGRCSSGRQPSTTTAAAPRRSPGPFTHYTAKRAGSLGPEDRGGGGAKTGRGGAGAFIEPQERKGELLFCLTPDARARFRKMSVQPNYLVSIYSCFHLRPSVSPFFPLLFSCLVRPPTSRY